MSTNQIWNTFGDRLLYFIQTKVNEQEDAKDILQDVFMRVHLNINKLKKEVKLESWVYQITRNAIIDFYRKRKNNKELKDDIIEDEYESLKDVISDHFLNCINPFIQTLPEIYKDPLNKTMFGELSQKEYAEKHNLSYPTVKSRVQRARKMVKDHFVECCKLQLDKNGNILEESVKNCSC